MRFNGTHWDFKGFNGKNHEHNSLDGNWGLNRKIMSKRWLTKPIIHGISWFSLPPWFSQPSWYMWHDQNMVFGVGPSNPKFGEMWVTDVCVTCRAGKSRIDR